MFQFFFSYEFRRSGRPGSIPEGENTPAGTSPHQLHSVALESKFNVSCIKQIRGSEDDLNICIYELNPFELSDNKTWTQ